MKYHKKRRSRRTMSKKRLKLSARRRGRRVELLDGRGRVVSHFRVTKPASMARGRKRRRNLRKKSRRPQARIYVTDSVKGRPSRQLFMEDSKWLMERPEPKGRPTMGKRRRGGM